jgi:hypothetical protein
MNHRLSLPILALGVVIGSLLGAGASGHIAAENKQLRDDLQELIQFSAECEIERMYNSLPEEFKQSHDITSGEALNTEGDL